MKETLVVTLLYLIKEFPIVNQVVYESKCLHIAKQQPKMAPGAFSRLTRVIITSLLMDTVKKEFKVDVCIDSIIDIATEFQNYQMQIIPESFYT